MVFYVFAMQCMSTLAVVKRETKSWKWPMIQLLYMTGLAYLMSFASLSVVEINRSSFEQTVLSFEQTALSFRAKREICNAHFSALQISHP